MDEYFCAWLVGFEDAVMRGADLTWWEQSAQHVRLFCTVRTNESQKLAQAYRNRDKEDKEASKLGHSCLKKARELGSIHLLLRKSGGSKGLSADIEKWMVDHKCQMTTAQGEKMTTKIIQIHVRVFKRLASCKQSEAQGAPSALDLLEKMEGIFGRRATFYSES